MPKAVKTFSNLKNVTDTVFFIVCKIYFLLVLIQVLDSKGIINMLKKSITSAMECTDETVFTFSM